MQSNLVVITLVGMPGAGKSTCVQYLEEKGIPSVYFGGITVDEVVARGLEVNAENEKLVREDIRSKEGPAAYANRIIAQIKDLHEKGHTCIVADGLYSWTEYKAFKDTYGENAVIIAVAATRSLRHKRLATRPVRPLGRQQAIDREYAEIENLEKGGPIANADFTLINDGSKEELLARFQAVLAQFGVIV